jgi:hypothetical protein
MCFLPRSLFLTSYIFLVNFFCLAWSFWQLQRLSFVGLDCKLDSIYLAQFCITWKEGNKFKKFPKKVWFLASIILTLRERQRATVDYSPLCHVTSIFGPCCFKKIGPFPPKKKRTSSTICRLLCHLAVGRHRMVGQFRGCIRLFRLVTLFIVYGPNYLM